MRCSLFSKYPTGLAGLCLGLLFMAHSVHAALDPAFTGAWFDPDFDGAGYFVEVLPDDLALVYWFTYDDSGGQRWYIGVGNTGADRIVIDELMEPQGGVFGADFDPDTVERIVVGRATLEFSACNTGRIDFQLDGAGSSSSQQLMRLTTIRDLPCGKATELGASMTRGPANQTGSWFDPARSGEGFIVEVLADNQVLVDWFTYDPDGNQAWLTGVGYAADDYIHVADMLITRNGRFGPEHDPAAVERDNWGALELRLDCNGGSATYDANDSAWGRGQQSLVRLTAIDGLNCEYEAFGPLIPDQLAGSWVSDGFGVVGSIDANSFSLLQLTASSCIEVITGPVATLLAIGDELTMTATGNRLRFEGLDSVTPVDINRVASLPPHCQGGGTGFTTDPLTVFDAFYNTFNELYSAFEVRGVDWAAERERALPKISPGMPQGELFSVLSSMLSPLNDGHVSLKSTTSSFFSGGSAELSALWTRAQRARTDQIISSRLSGNRRVAANGAFLYGLTDSGLAYLEINRFNDFLPDATQEETLAFLRPQLDTVFSFFNANNAKGLILDVRRNSGGNLNFGLEIAGRLNRGVTREIMSERRPVSSGLSTAIALSVEPVSGVRFDGPVALLTSQLTASAAEIFTFAIKSLPHATVIGQPSIGVLSRAERVLPNNWLVTVTAGQVESPGGEVFEAVGIPVDITTAVFSTEDLNNLVDSALDTAIDLLSPGAASSPGM